MTDQAAVNWPTCDEDGCIGVRLAATTKCLAHAPDEQRKETLKKLSETGEIDARGVPITQALLEQILAAAPHDGDNHAVFMAPKFEWATFQGDAVFERVTFDGNAQVGRATFQGNARFGAATFKRDAGFSGATFKRGAWFDTATFQGHAWFGAATFQDSTSFTEATFQGQASFGKATFQGLASFGGATFQFPAGFSRATFQDHAGFSRATFKRPAGFDGATFQGHASFDAATFQGHASFDAATFQRGAGFGRVTFRRDAGFRDASFEQARQLGPLLVYGVLRLDAAHFAQLIQIEVSTRGLSCQRARFPAGVQFRLRGAQVVLDDADLSSPSILVGIDALSDARLARREQRLVQAMRRLAPGAANEYSERPRLLSVQGANLAGLGVANIDLAQCRFAGAHNLDKLRFEAEVSFAAAPAWLPWDWRQVLAEERAWRAARSERWATPQWWPSWLHWPYFTVWPTVIEPAQLTGLYRALRKAREDTKDEPGAADFYYGEMEMRRHAGRGRTGGASRGQVERAVLTAYWLVSGYGLRAWRALTALALVLIAFAGLLVWKGYEDAPSSPDAPPASTSAAHPGSSSSTAAPVRPSAQMAPTTTGPTSPTAATTAPASPAASGADQSLVGSLLYGARTIIGLNPTPAPALTRFGEVLLIAVRVLGPLLLGLTLLALRGRVKR